MKGILAEKKWESIDREARISTFFMLGGELVLKITRIMKIVGTFLEFWPCFCIIDKNLS